MPLPLSARLQLLDAMQSEMPAYWIWLLRRDLYLNFEFHQWQCYGKLRFEILKYLEHLGILEHIHICIHLHYSFEFYVQVTKALESFARFKFDVGPAFCLCGLASNGGLAV